MSWRMRWGDLTGRRSSALRVMAALVCLVGAASIVLGTVPAAVQARASGRGADAVLACIDGDLYGQLSTSGSVHDNSASTLTSLSHEQVAFKHGSASVASFLVGVGLVSHADATLTNVNILHGLITADEISLVADASVGAHSADAGTAGSGVQGLTVNGTPVDPASSPIVVPGVGTLTVLQTEVSAMSPSPRAEVTGLRLRLTQDTDGLQAGAVLIVGQAQAQARRRSLNGLLVEASAVPDPQPVPKPSPRPTPTAKPTNAGKPSKPHASGSTHPAHTSATGSHAQSKDSGSAQAGTSAAVTPMAAAPPAPAEIVARFPNAVFPVDGGYSFVDDWHAPRKGHLHMGIDIAAAKGTPVVAVMDGHISSMDHAGAGGIELFLTTARGDSFLYCHFSRYAQGLHVGQEVQAGQVIAYVGATGDATGPHLHFEIRPGGGAAINPYPYLQAWRAAAGSSGGQASPTGTPAGSVAGTSVLSPTRRRSAFGVEDGVALASAFRAGRPGRVHDTWSLSVAMETTLTVIATGTLVALRRRMMGGAQLLGPGGARP